MTNKISLLSAILLSSTCMIGSGWLFSSQLAANLAGNYALFAWVAAALFMIIIALCFSKVIQAYPVRGVTTRSSSLSHNNVFGMPFAFANWFGVMVCIATEAQATTQYISGAISSNILMVNHEMTSIGKLFAFSILILYLLINFYGIKILAKVNNIITVFKVFVPLFIVVMFIIASIDNTKSNFLLFGGSETIGSIFTAIVAGGLIYCFNGFQIAASFCSEIKNPKRNVPLSMILSIIIVLGIYMLLQYGFMAALPFSTLSEAGGWAGLNFDSPLLQLSLILGFNFLSVMLLADSAVSPSGTGVAYLGGSTRMLTAMAREKQFPQWIAKIDPRYNFSRRSMLINFGISAVILAYAESWAFLMLLVTGYHIIGYMAAPISMGAISKKYRIIGGFVFVMIALATLAVPTEEMLLVVGSLSILLVGYGLCQHKQHGLKNILIFITPFTIYLWNIFFFNSFACICFSSIIFYLTATNPKYVRLANKSSI